MDACTVWGLEGQDENPAPAQEAGVMPVFKLVDTCAAEFESFTPYLYSTYEEEDEAAADRQEKSHHSGQRAESHRAGN